jgi:hypothetical protein
MKTDAHPQEVRTLVARAFESMGLEIAHPLDVEETIIVSDGRYMARSYRLGRIVAMWLIDVGIIQFYDADSNLLRVVNLFEDVRKDAA